MKKMTAKIVLMVMCISLLCVPAAFAAKGDVYVTLNGQRLEFDQSPVIENGRTLVPMRKIFESLNAIVEWNDAEQKVYAKKGSKEIELTINSNVTKVNGKEVVIDVPAKLVGERTMVPARFVAESLDCMVDWNESANTVIIKSGAQFKDASNLFNIDEVTYGKYNALADQRWWNDIYDYSSMMKVTPGDTIYITEYRKPKKARFITAYDKDKKVMEELGVENASQYEVPADVEYIRITTYAKETSYIKVSNSNESDGYIPEEIFVALDRTITIYGNQLLSDRRTDVNFEWECEIGEVKDNAFTIVGETIGEYPLKVTAKNLENKTIWTGNTVIKVVDNQIEKMKYLAIGDSLTNCKAWIAYLDEYSKGNVEFVGTRKYQHLNYKGTYITSFHEGRSGFTAGQYLSGKKYTFENEDVPEFFDGTRFNYKHYKETTGVNPDAIQIFLGINGIINNPQKNVDNIKRMIDYIRLDDENIPIFVVNTMYKGTLTAAVEHKKVFNLMEKLSQTLYGIENVYVVPVAITHNSESNYAEKDQVHPTKVGYEEIANCIYSNMCAQLR